MTFVMFLWFSCSWVIRVGCASFNQDTHNGSSCIIHCVLALQIRGCRCNKHLSRCPLMAARIHHDRTELLNRLFMLFRIILWWLLISVAYFFWCLLVEVLKLPRELVHMYQQAWHVYVNLILHEFHRGLYCLFTSCPSLSRLSSACAATVDNKQRMRCSVSLLQGGSRNTRSWRALSWSE